MPEIMGPSSVVISTMLPLEAHVAHLRHLSNKAVASKILIERFSKTRSQAKDLGNVVSAHIARGVEFHNQSLIAPFSLRPVMQYYGYLNFAVACILSYTPPRYEQYRHHGVEDRSHKLANLDLTSVLLRVSKRGAIPLFHSVFSDESLEKNQFRVNELLSAIPFVSYELQTKFGMKTSRISVEERRVEDKGNWTSNVHFRCFEDAINETV